MKYQFVSKDAFVMNTWHADCNGLNQRKRMLNFHSICSLVSSCKEQTVFKVIWGEHKVFDWGFSNHGFEIQFIGAIGRVKFWFLAVKFAKISSIFFLAPFLLQNVELALHWMKSFVISRKNNAKFPRAWCVLIFDWCKLFEAILKTFCLFRIKSGVVENKFAIGKVFTDHLA